MKNDKDNEQPDNKPGGADTPNVGSGDEYAKGWNSDDWDIVSDRPDVSKRNHVSGHPLTGKDDANEVHRDDDSGSSQRGMGGTTDDNRGSNPAQSSE